MKYPFVVFLRWDKYNTIDTYVKENEDKLDCTLFITDKVEDCLKLFNPSYQLLVTYGPDVSEYTAEVGNIIPDRFRIRWIHKTDMNDIEEFNRGLNYCFVHNCLDRNSSRPIFSIFTTCYNSYDKIFRAYNSLKGQSLKDWEWVMLDDSPDSEHFKFLKQTFKDDYRVRLYSRDFNSGNIGNVKNEAVSLCRGKYVLELDHDDEILPSVLEDASKVFDEHEEVGFVYMNFINIYENGDNFRYGDFICKGYGGYHCQKYNGKWVYVYNTPNINNITMTHLVCCPNHPRMWRRSTLMEIGNYPEMLPICDDFEIIIRTSVKTKMAKIPKLAYVQYMNHGNNNFSLIRNAEINRIGPYHIYPQFYSKYNVHEYMKSVDAYEDESYIYNHSKIWERPSSYVHKYCNLVINPDHNIQYCVIGAEKLHSKEVKTLDAEGADILVLDNILTNEQLWSLVDQLGLDKVKTYSLKDCTTEELKQYFLRIYKSCNDYEFI